MTRQLAREACLSEKRFIDVFRREVGLTPRLFHRICRFQRVLAGVHQNTERDWASFALDHGYFDRTRRRASTRSPCTALYTRYLGFRVDRENKPNFVMLSRGNLELVLSTPYGPGGAAKPMPDGRKAEPGGWNRIIGQGQAVLKSRLSKA